MKIRFTPEGKIYVKKKLSEINIFQKKTNFEGNWREFKREIFNLDVTFLINRERREVRMLIEGEEFEKGSPLQENDEDVIEDWLSAFIIGGMRTLVEVTDLALLFREKSPELHQYLIMG